MARIFRVLILMFFAMEASGLHAALTSAKARQLQDYKNRCDDQGLGKACYDYARMLWSQPGAIDRASARKYLLRGCELNYKSACQAYHAHAFTVTPVQKKPAHVSSCFHDGDMKRARISDGPKGPRLAKIQPRSFWARAGFENGDRWTQVDDTPVNNVADGLVALKKAKRQMVFQVIRHGVKTTLVFSCH